jgi:hypothetical protein
LFRRNEPSPSPSLRSESKNTLGELIDTWWAPVSRDQLLEEARRNLIEASARAWEIKNALSYLLEDMVKIHGDTGRENHISEQHVEELVDFFEEALLKIDMLTVFSEEVVDKIDEALEKIEGAMKMEE